MGQILSLNRASRSNTTVGAQNVAQNVAQPRRNNTSSPESLPAPTTPQTSQYRADVRSGNASASSATGSGSPHSLSQPMQRPPIRPRRRTVGIEDNVPVESSPTPPVTKRRWLRNLRSRPVSGASSSSTLVAQDPGVGPSKRQEPVPITESTTGETSTSTRPLPANPVVSVQSGPSSAAEGAVLASDVPPIAEHASSAPRVEPIAQTEQNSQATAPSTTPSPSDPSTRGPPGSLIIVQGIVHAQDNPAPSSAPESASTAAATPNLRPSSFLPRRASAPPPSRHSFSQSPYPSSTASPSPSGTDTSNRETTNATHSTSPADNNDESPLSQSSIEVLGTLLSFATAATAASLVTGTIDPLFHSGLAPSAELSSTETSQTPDRSRRPRSMLGGVRERLRGNRRREAEDTESSDDALGELARAINAAAGRTQQAADAATPSANSPSLHLPSTSTPTPGLDHERSQEVVACANPAELPESQDITIPQQDHPAPLAPSVPAAALPSSAARALPPPRRQADDENSFERFLHNLQADLRTALSEDYARPTNPTSLTPATSASPSRSAGDSPPSTSAVASGSISPDASSATSAPIMHAAEPADVSRTDDQPVPRNEINWWRLYRFPPRSMPPGTAVVAVPSDSPTQPPLPTADVNSSTTQDSAARLPSSLPTAAESRNTSAPGGIARSRAAALVVPVIVVGLQSVSPREAAEILPQEVLQEADNAATGMPATEGTQRRGPTLTRAARMLNRLSNIPRGTDSLTASTETVTPASAAAPQVATPRRAGRGRTFLIYVIGGYYPMDHSIVTGNFDSFEALSQLSELLGQVKPPVATRAEIDRSGLEVLKAKMLPEYKKDGKVAENTVERCLVCLDDYQDEDDLRLLSCRHAFHKDCVDKWLEEGKNNCPACRAKGVPTSSDATPESAAALNDAVLEPRA